MSVLFVLCVGCLLLYCLMVLRAAWYFGREKEWEESPENWPSVEIIIPARNEAANITACLKSVLAQQYPGEWQITLINDQSTDETYALATALAQQNPRLKVVNLQAGEENSFKKAAISQAIAASKMEMIQQLDADCLVGEKWLMSMMYYVDAQTAMVSGPILLYDHHNLFTSLQTMESMGLVALGAGSMMAGQPNLANAANLAYRRSVFERVGGFKDVDQVASGDDELLLQKIHRLRSRSIRYAKSRDAIVRTAVQPTWQTFKAQRLRWVSKARAYENRWTNVIQLISYAGFVSFPLSLVLILLGEIHPLWPLVLLLFKSVADLPLMYLAAGFFHKLPLLRYFPLLQLVYIPYVLWIGIAGNLVKKYQWKDRMVQ
ncbi:MAG: glycosyltransferase [Bacteroidota bacterium]